MPQLLIAGYGYLGQAVAELFSAADWQIEGWTMSPESAAKLSGRLVPVHSVDISKREAVAARAKNFDVVIHSASTRGGDAAAYRRVYLDGARNLLDQFGSARTLFISSTSVYAQTNGEWVTEESAADPSAETGKILREAEELIRAGSGTVLRLGGIYGPGRSALLKKFLSGQAILDPENDRFVNEIHRDDAVRAIQLLGTGKENAGQVFNVVDDEPVLQSECYRWLAAKLNRPLPPVGTPVLSGVEGSTSKRKRGQTNKRVRNAKLRAVGWVPRFRTFAEGMEKSVLPSFNLEAT